jgi:Regulator of RNA terminal phosphate cyclase
MGKSRPIPPALKRGRKVLLTWVGQHDPYARNPRTKQPEEGPILSLLNEREFDTVYVLLNIFSQKDDFKERATGVLRAVERRFPKTRVVQKPLDVISVTDYTEIYRFTNDVCQQVLREHGTDGVQYFVYLSPGTPQMQTVWVLLVQSGLFPATMLLGTEAYLVEPGAPRVREVDLSLPNFPQVVSPKEASRLIGIVEAQRDSLNRENLELKAKLANVQAGGTAIDADQEIPSNFTLHEHLRAVERAYYAKALAAAEGRASDAARLLGVEGPTFRARAATFGLRPRRASDSREKASVQ